MKKSVLILVLAISINCAFAQLQHSNNPALNKVLARIQQLTGNVSQFPKLFNNENQIIKNEQLKSNKFVKWECDTFFLYNTSSTDSLGQLTGQGLQTFDSHGNVLTEEVIPQDSSGIDSTKYIFTYDTNGNVLTWTFELYKNKKWNNEFLYTLTYSANGNLLTFLTQQWENNAWLNNQYTTATYDVNGNIESAMSSKWDKTNSTWTNYSNDTYTVNSNGNITKDISQLWVNNAWVNNENVTETYDGKGNQLTETDEYWNNSAWADSTKDTYTYDVNNNMLTFLYQQWLSNGWVNNNLDNYHYDANGNLLTDIYQIWGNGAWINSSKTSYTYDANGNRITGAFYFINGNTWQPSDYGNLALYPTENPSFNDYGKLLVTEASMFNVYRFTAHWISSTSGINQVKINNEELTIYPNPSTGQINIKLQNNINEYNVKIYNEVGEIVYQTALSKSQEVIDISNQPAGMYFIKLESMAGAEVRKVIITK